MANSRNVKELPCKYCRTKVEVSSTSVAVTCWRCTSKLAGGNQWNDKIFLDELENI